MITIVKINTNLRQNVPKTESAMYNNADKNLMRIQTFAALELKK